MKAKSKYFLPLVLLISLFTAQNVYAKPKVIEDKCRYLSSIDPMQVHKALTTFSGSVMGKHPERWTSVDYASLIANAQNCDGLPVDVKKKVSGKFWKAKLIDAEKRNFEINAYSIAIANAYKDYWKSDKDFPACATFLKWERDDLWYTDNSKDIFNQGLDEMSPMTQSLYKRLAEECLPVMKSILQRWRIAPENADFMSKSIIYSIDLHSEENMNASEALPESLRVYRNGRQIPISYLRKTTRDIVNRISGLENSDRVMSTNTLIQISKWANQVVNETKSGPDHLYAIRVKKIVSDHMFNSIDELKDFGAASAKP